MFAELKFTNAEGTRKAGRPPIRCMDSVEEDLNRSGVSNWKTKAANRVE